MRQQLSEVYAEGEVYVHTKTCIRMVRGGTGEAAIPYRLPFLSIAQISDLGLPCAALPWILLPY